MPRTTAAHPGVISGALDDREARRLHLHSLLFAPEKQGILRLLFCSLLIVLLTSAASWRKLLHMDKTLPPPKPPRVSVPVSAEVLAAFQRLAAAGNMSTGKAIAQWLEDTLEAAEYMAATMERARAAPKVVMREMHAYALGLADETGELMRTLAEKGKAERAKASDTLARKRSAGERGGGLSESTPPSCNTGGKVPRNTSKKNKGES